MELVSATLEAFEPQGMIARAVPGFRPREPQLGMARAVAEAMARGGSLVVEAGTGVGKTFAYLVPALLSGRRVLVSTATKTLQDQLFSRDLPTLVRATGVPVQRALLKGRASYLCLHRLELARQDAVGADASALRTLARIERWAQVTRSGDLAEVEDLDERSPVVPLVTSTRENCLGSDCPQWKACHVNLARREAMAADVVVVNHHLFFADLAVRETGMAELLPTVDVMVFDEAHQLNETGVQFLGRQLGTGQLLDFARDLLAGGLQVARGLADWRTLAADVERGARDLRMAVGRQPPGTRLRWLQRTPEGVANDEWERACADLADALDRSADALEPLGEITPDLIRLRERALELQQRLDAFSRQAPADHVRWVDAGAQLRLVESPLDIAEALRAQVLEAPGAAGRAHVFTSATLGDDEALSWFTRPLGLGDAQVLRVGSPFDFERQAGLYVPRAFPRPNEPGHAEAVVRLAAQAVRAIGGRTLVLTTTLRAMRSIAAGLGEALMAPGDPRVLLQGTASKRSLIAQFEAAGSDGRGAVLVASASFWEGVDLPGDVLQLVIVDKLPFPPPGDPLVEARTRRIEAEGGHAFTDYFVAEAAVTLKQGAGRLIRREDDRGVLAICDTRLVGMSYGRRLLAALPPMRRLQNEGEWLAALAALTTASTTHCREA